MIEAADINLRVSSEYNIFPAERKINMKQIGQSILGVVLVALIALLGLIVLRSYQETQRQAEEELRQEQQTPAPTSTPEPTPEVVEEPENFVEIKLGVCGDIVVHSGLNAEAQQEDGSYNYTSIFSGVWDAVSETDYAICTMETTFPETVEYTGYPMFKSPTELATSLKTVGFDMVNTASNHSVDGLKAGIFRTLDILDLNGLDHVGTYRSQEERDANNGILVKDINGISIAFLSYTYGTNAIPVTGFEYAVNIFYNDYLNTLSDINYDLLREDMAAARALNTDLILVQMHWGLEYETSPKPYQIELSDFLFREGADIIIGGHPHVPQPMELRKVTDEDGTERTCFIVYSMGNLVSCMDDRYTDLTVALNIGIQKNIDTGETVLRQIQYYPVKMMDMLDYGVDPGYRYATWNLYSAISGYENGNDLGVINDVVLADIKEAVEDIRGIMGTEFDYAYGGVDAAQWALEN